jgi:flagellin
MVSYSDVVEAGNYQITGIDVSFMNLTGTTGVDKKGIFLENGSETNISVKKILEDGSMVDYMPNGMTATVNEDVLTLQDATGKKIQLQIDETFSGTVNLELTGTGAMTMQVGANEGQTLDIRIQKVSLTTLGLYNLDVSNEVGAREAIESVKNAISEISGIRSRLGAYQNRLEHTVSNLDISVENMTAAYSRIMDVDMAEEMTTYSTQQVLSQAGISMMAQANERPSQVLQLLQ